MLPAIERSFAKWDAAVRAAPIPVLPDLVAVSRSSKVDISQIPVGLSKEAVEMRFFDLAKTPIMLVLSEDDELAASQTLLFGEILSGLDGMRLEIMDTSERSEDQILSQISAIQDTADPPGCIAVVPSLSDIFDKYSQDVGTRMKDLLGDVAVHSSKRFIVGDAPWKLSKYSFEPWYKKLVYYGSGLWLGDGIANQQALRIGMIRQEHRHSLERGYGYTVVKGVPELIKLIGLDSKGCDAHE